MQNDNSGMRLTICMIISYISIPKSHFFSYDGHKTQELLSEYIFSVSLGEFRNINT